MECCNEASVLTVEDAQEKIVDAIEFKNKTEIVQLDIAGGRYLAEDIFAPFDTPFCDNSAMDGFGFIHDDFKRHSEFREVGESLAGHPFRGSIKSGECIRIMTGATVPEGIDTVVMREKVTVQGKRIQVHSTPQAGQNIRLKGEDIKEGQVVLKKNKKINAADIAIMATFGMREVNVYQPVTIAIFSTGDEIISVNKTKAPGLIYDSNKPMLIHLLKASGFNILDLGIIPDDKKAIETAIKKAEDADAIITSGGVSVGDADFTTEVLKEQGDIDFWKLAIKPGKPFAFGHVGTTPFFGLPGNPVSALLTCQILAIPGLLKLSGSSTIYPQWLTATLTTSLKKRPGRTDYQRGIYSINEQGQLSVASSGAQGSALLMSVCKANCLIRLPKDSEDVAEGVSVEVLPFAFIPGL
ncbi:molybdopterin molybdotransferase MoeA [Salinivibrio sp. SS2]|uniref:molybdopterin molybdotransferase MoeA n=1 Tax=Salinivibrio sp. SS2 TaxID=1892894 RepID=UPI00084CA611|nr:gephyrin-like molybdotransferase Glp [Salinivibrio sp. DV]ODQ00518.1 hypothetical protein BGK46_06260 [Salinivibrio sp. DV]